MPIIKDIVRLNNVLQKSRYKNYVWITCTSFYDDSRVEWHQAVFQFGGLYYYSFPHRDESDAKEELATRMLPMVTAALRPYLP